MTRFRSSGSPALIGRRAALLLSAGALAGCSVFNGDIFDDWFGTSKKPLPGKREPVLATQPGFAVDPNPAVQVTLPPMTANADWPQMGGDATHAMGHLATSGRLTEAWRADIGDGGGYRRRLTAQPVVAAGHVFTMDSDANVDAFDLRNGARIWRTETRAKKNRSTNLGGGIAWNNGTVYVSTGRADVLALDAAKGSVRWRVQIDMPARSAPTFADGRLHVTTIDDRLITLSADDGHRMWAYQAANPQTSVLGAAAPAVKDGLVVAGFGTGALITLRADTGAVAWSESLAGTGGRSSLVDLSAVQGMPVIDRDRVFAVSLGGIMLSLDLRTGRRLWERDVASSQTPWVVGDWIFLISTDQQLAAMSREDGRVQWLTDLPRWKNTKKQRDPVEWIGPILTHERLIVASNNNQALTVDPFTGVISGQHKLPGPASVSPVVASGMLFLVSDDGTLIALH
jgi:outer membrane protein assembly factor BamB